MIFINEKQKKLCVNTGPIVYYRYMDYLKDRLSIKLPANFQTIDPETQKKQVNSWWELIKFALFTFLIILPIRLYVIQPFIVSGESMVPTFHDHDYLIIDELTYRFKPPQRGDVIVFRPPNQPKGVFYIKRVIGLPGETITLKGSKITVTSKDQPEEQILREPYIQNITTENMVVTVEEGELFVLGDNRPRSSDSRIWGKLPIENVTGRALIRLYPFRSIDYLPGAQEVYNYDPSPIALKNN